MKRFDEGVVYAGCASLFLTVVGAAVADVPVVRASYENAVYYESLSTVLPDSKTNRVVKGVAAGIGGVALSTSNYLDFLAHSNALVDVQLGAPCGAVGANYGLGEVLIPPEGADADVAPNLNGAENLLWIDYAKVLLTVDGGAATVDWSMGGSNIQTVVYTVSTSPKVRPVRLYWTDDADGKALQNAGPTVQFGQNYRVDLHYNNSITGDVGSGRWSYGDENAPPDVWLDGNILHAKEGVNGRFLLSYSRLDADTGRRILLGYEVVEVLEPMSNLQHKHVGDRLLPLQMKYEISDLFSTIARGSTDTTGENPDDIFVYKHMQGSKNGWIWAIRETEAAWQIEIYWKAKEQLDVIWPFEVDIYDISWGDDLQQYVRGDLDAGDLEPKVYLPMELTAEVLPYQTRDGDSGGSDTFSFVADGALYTTDLGKFLMRYTAGTAVWFEPVLAVGHSASEPAVCEVASELRPPDEATHGEWPGYLYEKTGTYYNPNYYDYPLQYEAPADLASAVYGVNRGTLEVWWANASKLSALAEANGNRMPYPVYYPSLACQYALVWPTNANEVVVASGRGSLGLTVEPDAQPPLDLIGDGGSGFEASRDQQLASWQASAPFTLEAWLNPSALAGAVFKKGQDWSLDIAADGVPALTVGSDTVSAGVALQMDVWQHLAVSRDASGQVRFFLDGDMVHSEVFPATLGSNERLTLGAAFFGHLNEVRVWDEARSAAEIRATMRRQLMASDPVPAFDLANCELMTPPVYSMTLQDTEWSGEIPAWAWSGAFSTETDWQEQGITVNSGSLNDYADGGFSVPNYYKSHEGTCTNTLTLTDLPEHQTLGLGMHLGQIGSLDPARDNDVFYITVDDVEVFHVGLGFGQGGGSSYESVIQSFRLNGEPADTNLLVAARTLLLVQGNNTLSPVFDEHLYDLSQLAALQAIPHTSPTAVIRIVGRSNQEASTEHYGLDNLKVSVHGISNSVLNDSPPVVSARPGRSLAGGAPELYIQTDPAAAGYNPNEEHALILQDTVYALRTDLNQTNAAAYTSDPFVLAEYTDELGQPAMAIFEVVVSNELYSFDAELNAGLMLQAPAPLNQMQPSWCASNTFSLDWIPFKDRNGRYWAEQAGDDGGSKTATANLYYPNRADFWHPPGTSPAVGDQIPLKGGDELMVDYEYVINWPEAVPGLYVGDTLTNPKNGLPAIRDQLSVDLLYQQSVQQTNLPSVILIDPTATQTAALEALPGSMKSYRDPKTGYTLFSELPPALRSRLYWNPTASEQERFQLAGEYRERSDGHNYLLLNVLTGSDYTQCTNANIVTGQDEAWSNAVVEVKQHPVVEMTDDITPFDSLALSTVGTGSGYVTLAFNNSTNTSMVAPSENVSLAVIRVEPELYQGQLDVIESPNPLDRQLTLHYTADFGAQADRFEFQWYSASPIKGSAPDIDDASWSDQDDAHGHFTSVGDTGVLGLSDVYLRCRYRALDPDVISVVGTNWSSWTPPQLCENWIKRAMKGINPYEQRIRDYMNYAVDPALSMLQQAGAPYNGDVPLNHDALDEYGLISIYESIFKQARGLSIDADTDAPASLSLTLMMVSGRLSDFYMMLGNEAYADALNPTVTLGSEDPVDATEVSSIFCFQNQFPDLLSEELALLRGRDATMNPAVTNYPLYNRIPWNFTADIVGGEVAYALNYGISDLKGNQDGSLNAEDAQLLFPQGHGDAWGHYLSAIKKYYYFMNHPRFEWKPQVEGLLVMDTTVTVSYLHEKKFARAAAAKARAGVDILGKTGRQAYGVHTTWASRMDSLTNRAWGVNEWAGRVGQGTYFDWLSANSLLPDYAANSTNSGIRIIDRATTPELNEMVKAGQTVQQQIDALDAGLNPLGLAENAVPFDISAAGIDAGETHFEQVYQRAKAALQHAAEIFDRVQACAQALRDQNEAREFDQSMADEEVALDRRLIEIYGYPYSDDIGPGKLYPQGYSGPDLVHYTYIESYSDGGSAFSSEIVFTNTSYILDGYKTIENSVDAPLVASRVSEDILEEAVDVEKVQVPNLLRTNVTVRFNIGASGIPCKPVDYLGQRRAEGEIQIAYSQYIEALREMESAGTICRAKIQDVERTLNLYKKKHSYAAARLSYTIGVNDHVVGYREAAVGLDMIRELMEANINDSMEFVEDLSDASPTSVGFSVDVGAPVRYTAATITGTLDKFLTYASQALRAVSTSFEMTAMGYESEKEGVLLGLENNFELVADRVEFYRLLDELEIVLVQFNESLQTAETARMNYSKVIAEGDALQVERERLRMNYASDLNAKRYRNMAYQIFRNDELQRYSEAFDLAARYCYLAAKAYDYETGLLAADEQNPAGRDFMEQIVKARTIGRMTRGAGNSPDMPLVGGPVGDPGLAHILARMKANWDVLDGRLGFNNPQTETGQFSLRQELFRILPSGGSSDANWRQTLESCRVDNILELEEFKRYCLPFTPQQAEEPAIVIPFSTTIEFRKNFFGKDLAGGDNAYDSTHFATKIRSAGVWFSNFDNAFANGVANQPRVYLLPVGIDRMRVPSGELDQIRNWQVADQALPVPYPLSQQDWSNPDWSVLKDTLGNELFDIRKYPSLRAYHDKGSFDDTEVVNNSRLIGRSVWNTKWLLIIPGGTLLSDADEGLDRFIHGREESPGIRTEHGVDDIKIFFQTYSYSGN